MARVGSGAFRACSPEVNSGGRRHWRYWSKRFEAPAIKRSPGSGTIAPSHLPFLQISRGFNPKFQISARRPLTLSGANASRRRVDPVTPRPEPFQPILEALGG